MRILALINSDYGVRHLANITQYTHPDWTINQWRAPVFFPLVIDYPEEFLPKELPAADLILSFAEHKSVAELIPDIAKMTGAKAVIAAIDNQPVQLAGQIQAILNNKAPGASVLVRLRRNDHDRHRFGQRLGLAAT